MTTHDSVAMLLSAPSSIPALHAFDQRTSTWQSYRDRLQFYFMANRTTDDEDKKALFLWSVGDVTYNLLESLVSPNTLTDPATTYSGLVALLDAHFDVTKNIMTATYDFYSCHQKPNQPFADWKADLCDKLRHCAFTKSVLKDKLQDRALRDMYVIGTNNAKTRQALLKEKDPDLQTAERIIQVAERLQLDIQHFNMPTTHSSEMPIAKLHTQGPINYRPQTTTKPSHRPTNDPCQSCGATGHLRTECKYRDFSCNFCKRNGHLEKVCRQKNQGKHTAKPVQAVHRLNHVNNQSTSLTRPTQLSLRVNDHRCTFEVDTGADQTIVSVDDWHKLGSPTLRHSTLRLQCYSGTPLVVTDQCLVQANYHDRKITLPMIVVQNAGLPLLGLAWIKHSGIDLNRLIHGPTSTPHSVGRIYNQSALQALLSKHKPVFDKGLGHCTKLLAHIQLKPDAVPKFFKPRPMPFAFVDGVKDEIRRNVDAGILQRVDTSPWAAPIVPVRKATGQVRICGDFKVTINPQILVDQHPIPSIDELLTNLNNGEQFTKLDLSDAYLQVELDEAAVSHIREIGDNGDACRYEEMSTQLKSPAGSTPGYAYPSRDEPSLAEMTVSLARLCERCTRILHLHLPHLHYADEGEEES